MIKIWLYSIIINLLPLVLIAQNQVSPDGSKVITYKVSSQNTKLISWDLISGKQNLLTPGNNFDYNPQWSRKSTDIYFYRMYPKQKSADIFKLNRETGLVSAILEDSYYSSDPSPSYDDKSIAFTSNMDGDYDLYLMQNDGTNVKQITFNDSSVWSPSWSPDGEYIAYTSNLSGQFEIYLINLSSSKSEKLTSLGGENYIPDIGPDGTTIAFMHRDSPDSNFDVLIVNSTSRDVVNVSKTSDENEYVCGWSPDGNRIFFYCDFGICSNDKQGGSRQVEIEIIVD